MQFCISHPSGAFICFARALVFEGSALTYDPTINQAEWDPVRGMVADLSPIEERSALALHNLVPHDEEEAEERMDRFGKRGDVGGAAGGGAKEDPSQETPHTEASREDEMEMDEESRDQGGDVVSHPEVDDDTEVDADDEDKQSDSGSMGQGLRRGHSWGERCESENKESDPFSKLTDTETEEGCEEEFLQTLPPSPWQKLETLCQVSLGVNGPATLGEAAVATSSPVPTPEQEGVPSEDEVSVHAPEDSQQGLD